MTLTDAERAILIEELARAATGRVAGLGREALGGDAQSSDPPAHLAHRRSPTCGDEVTVQVVVAGDRLAELRWDGRGCTVSLAAASALGALAPGRTLAEAREMAAAHLAAVARDREPDSRLPELEPFAGIGRFPLRAGCATLAWRAMLDAIGF